MPATFATLDPAGLGMFAALIGGALHVAWQGERLAWLYLAALGCLIAGAGAYYLTQLEVIMPGPLTLQALNLGSVGECLLRALAHRINRLTRERDAAQQALIAALRESEQRLEQQVSARTRELAEANAQLTALAERDALTGLYNRRRFDAQLTEELARAQRSGRRRGLLLLDNDHFKDVNDFSGHTQGDVTLARLGRLVDSILQRRTDHAYRVGGQEFVVLAPDSTEEGLRQLGERLCSAVQAQHWPHPMQLCITVSVGLTLLASGDTPTSIYRRADAALHEAKRSGRNRCARAAPPH
ncbi:GGDEF domain-containing protein [Tepidimonas sp.]|uniref:GGDEF domain-containing protein n=1 Tax=Tepidimonas sp. TaxID=2002775 RepID=UPI002FE408DC